MRKYIIPILISFGLGCSNHSNTNTTTDNTDTETKHDSTATNSANSATDVPEFEVKFHHDEKGKKAQEDQYVRFNYALTNEKGDTLASTYATKLPFEVLLKPLGENDLIFKLITQMSAGDSASFFTNAKSYHQSEGKKLPDSINANERYEFRMKLISVQTQEEKLTARRLQEDQMILKHVKKHYPDALKDEQTGLYLVYQRKGKGSEFPPQLGDSIRFKYTTKYLNNILLDSSDDKEVGVQLSPTALIAGWRLALTRYMNKGTKITLFLPSHLAFGAETKKIRYKEQITRLSAFSILKCELELTEVYQKNR